MAATGHTPRGLVIAAPASGSGKTLITTALLSALRRRGLNVACAKAGPDYIDPKFHEAAAGRPSVNLDLWAMGAGGVSELATRAAAEADVLLVEGVMGLFDGSAAGADATADLAVVLGLPVVLVVDAGRQSQSVAALVHGFATWDPRIDVAGVILTRVASDRHEAMLRDALAAGRVPCLGVLRQDRGLVLVARHLGLVQASEVAGLTALIDRAAEKIGAAVSLDRLVAVSKSLVPLAAGAGGALAPLGQTIAVAHDVAFAFAYPHLLAGWRAAGAEIVPFSPLADEAPAARADAVFLPGGYPELHAGTLAAARRFHGGMAAAAQRGALIYGECGGYMVMGAHLTDADGIDHPMLGLLSHVTSFKDRRRTLGYRRLRHDGPLPFPADLTGHEFHYATIETTSRQACEPPLFLASDAGGVALGPIGGRCGRVCGSFAHVIASSAS